jgi:GNAT superfamily N-acetyltransferase
VRLVVRRAGDADVPALARLRETWTEEDDGGPVDDDGFGAAFLEWWELEGSRRRHWLAEVDGAVIGMVSVVDMRRMPRPGRSVRPWGYVHHVFVAAAHRDAGVGADLMAAAIDACRADGYEQLVLNPRARSRPFYERLGFRSAAHLVVLPLS